MPRPPAHNPAPLLHQHCQRRLPRDRREYARISSAMTGPNASPKSTLLEIAGVLHFVEDQGDPWAVVNCYKDLMAPGSFLVISHVTADHLSEDAARQARAAYAGASAPGVARTREQIAGFFGGLDMVAPGLVDVSEWRPDHIGPLPGPAVFYAGIGCKTRPGRPR